VGREGEQMGARPFGVLALFCLWSASASAGEEPVLEHLQAWVVETPDGSRSRLDPSGLARWQGQLVTISDKAGFPDVYALHTEGGPRARTAILVPWRVDGAGSDTEGLAQCGDSLFVVVEDRSQLVKLSTDGQGAVLELDLSTAGDIPVPPQWMWLNAGLEGVACAPDGRLWVAKEREPRAIFVVDGRTGRARSVWTLRAASDAEQEVGETRFWPSWSDLQYADGHLYALHRDGRRIVRLDPQTGVETAHVRLALDESLLYEGARPWGMAEGMLLEEDRIWVILDNNARTTRAGPRAGEPAPMLFLYARPEGF